jgi:hypothetical protein
LYRGGFGAHDGPPEVRDMYKRARTATYIGLRSVAGKANIEILFAWFAVELHSAVLASGMRDVRKQTHYQASPFSQFDVERQSSLGT